jgi:hypothetical protein
MGYVVSFEGRLKMGKTDKDLKKRKWLTDKKGKEKYRKKEGKEVNEAEVSKRGVGGIKRRE